MENDPVELAKCNVTTNICTWTDPSKTDPKNSYQWVAATNQNAKWWNTTGLNANTAGQYLYDATTSKLMSGGAVCPTGDACSLVKATDPLSSSTMLGAGYVMSSGGADHSTYTTNGVNSTHAVDGGVVYSDGKGASTSTGPGGVRAVDGKGNFSEFASGGVTVINTAGDSSKITAGGATFTNATGSTKIDGGDVTATGTVTATKAIIGGRDVGAELTDHDQRITHVQTQADATDFRLNNFTPTGYMSTGSLEDWAGNVNNHLGVVDNRLDALEGWQGVAKAQISDLYNRSNKLEEGVAMAMSMTNISLAPSEHWGVDANYANFGGKSALGFGGAINLGNGWQANAAGSLGVSEGQFGGRVGVSYRH